MNDGDDRQTQYLGLAIFFLILAAWVAARAVGL